MYSNSSNMFKQTSNLINALKKLKQNLNYVKIYANSDKTLALYFLNNAYSDFNLFKTIFQSVTPGNQKIEEFIKEFGKIFEGENKYLLSIVNESGEDTFHKELTLTINKIETYLLHELELYR